MSKRENLNLTLTGSNNYDSWAKRIMAKISSWGGISYILTGTAKPEDTTIKRNIVNHEASVIDLIQENVSTAILKEIDDFATAREAWDYLALLYTVHNDCEKARWKAKLTNFGIEDKEPAVEVFRRLMTIVNVNELKKQGVVTPDEQVEETFLEALTDTRGRGSAKDEPSNWKKGTIVLSTDVKKGTDKFRLGRNKNKRKETITCSGCNIPDHSINQCRHKEVECNAWGNKGHIKKYCK
eukprot:Pgem_evm2s1484